MVDDALSIVSDARSAHMKHKPALSIQSVAWPAAMDSDLENFESMTPDQRTHKRHGPGNPRRIGQMLEEPGPLVCVALLGLPDGRWHSELYGQQ